MTQEQSIPKQYVFRFFDGYNWVYGDPLELNRRLWFTAGKLDDVIKKVNFIVKKRSEATSEEIKEGHEAMKTLISSIRAAFEMQPIDKGTGQGATNAHCMAVYEQFRQFEKSIE